jgi:hypothetical protein
MMHLDMIAGSGGVLSHAPRRAEAAYMMLDAYQPEGVTMLAVDSIFMMPQLGVLSVVHPEAAAQVFERDCLIKLGSVIAPVGTAKEGEIACTVEYEGKSKDYKAGTLTVEQMALGESREVTIKPGKSFDMGAGKGKPVTRTVEGGVVGLIIDTRCRPIALPQDDKARIAKLREWHQSLALPVE